MDFRGDFDTGGISIPTMHGSDAARPRPFAGQVPTNNPWAAAYPEPKSQGRLTSHVVYGKVNRFCWEGTGNLSVKTVFSGHALVETGGGLHRIDPSSYLVVNHGRDYKITIESDKPVDGLSMFFEPRILGQALRSRRQRISDELNTPIPSSTSGFELFERMFESDAVGQQLTKVHEELPNFKHDPMWVQESLHTTLDLLLDRQSEAWHEVNQVQAVRAVTKEELYRRLYKARDYAYATLDQPVSLDDLAYVACLSTNYFLRSFRGLYKQTPHQFIISKRMDRARSLLKTTDLSVSEICLAVGFQSLGSFSWLFKRRCGLSPEAFRRHEQLIGPIL